MAGFDVELLFGTMFIGLLLSSICYGIMTLQMFMYYQTYKKDTVWIRYFVLYLFMAESINLLLEFGIVYQPLIVHYGDPQALIVSPLLLPGDAASIVMVSTPIQIFTAWRINVITGKKLFSALIILLALLSFGGGVGVGVFSGVRNEFAEFQSFRGVVSIWLISSAMCDVLIALILTFSLRSRKTGFTAVDGQINRIIRLTVQTGAITAIAALADLILFLAFPTTTSQFIPDFPLSKLYSICLISTLNARYRKRDDAEQQRVPNPLFKDYGSDMSGGVSGTRDMSNTTGNGTAGGMGIGSMTSPVHVYSPPPHYPLGSNPTSYANAFGQSSMSTLVGVGSGNFSTASGTGKVTVDARPRPRPRSHSQPPAMGVHSRSQSSQSASSASATLYDEPGNTGMHTEAPGPPRKLAQVQEPQPKRYVVGRPRKDSAAAALQLQLGQNPAGAAATMQAEGPPAVLLEPAAGPQARRPMPSGPRTRT